MEAGFAHEIGNETLLHFSVNATGALLTKMKFNDGARRKLTKEEYENLSRIDVTVGLTFGK